MSVISFLGGTEEADKDGLVTGFNLARRLGTDHLVQSALPDAGAAVVYASSPYAIGLGAGAVEQVRAAQADLIEAWRTVYEDIAASHSAIPARHEHATCLTERAAAQAATLADVLVFPRSAGRSGHPLSHAFQTVLMGERLPVLLSGTSPIDGETLAIAWDGSPQAARAVRFHMPLIKAAKRVCILQNPEDLRDKEQGSFASTDALQTWLASHGVVSEAEAIGGVVGQSLLQTCMNRALGILVAGAFGHSRAGEFLFGGASRDFLNAEKAPALALAH